MIESKISPQESVENLFGAPLLRLVWADKAELNGQLKKLILEKSQKIESATQSNKGGWQSPKEFQNWKEPCVERFMVMADSAAVTLTRACLGETAVSEVKAKWTITAWANVNRFSNYNGLHNHSGGFWSGVYYVSSGIESDQSSQEGSISFRNPTLAPLAMANLGLPPAMSQIFRTSCTVKPIDGLMLLFPSWLEHYVHPYFGDESRISISWDVIFPRDVHD